MECGETVREGMWKRSSRCLRVLWYEKSGRWSEKRKYIGV